MTPIIQPEQLLPLMDQADLILIDARAGADAREKYLSGHLVKAQWVDLETDLSDIKEDAQDGGRHPLPGIDVFSALVAGLGITPDSHVVVYDDRHAAMAAARFWWMLRAIGHHRVQVLDGGFELGVKRGLPLSQGVEKNQIAGAKIAYPSHEEKGNEWLLPTVTLDEVEQAGRDGSKLIIDVREPERYRGEVEPYDLVAGHIPGAVNIFYGRNLDENGCFLPPELLHSMYKEVIGKRTPEQIIVHCGSGVTACHTLLAMDYAKLPVPKLYVGSYSEWIRNDKPIETAR